LDKAKMKKVPFGYFETRQANFQSFVDPLRKGVCNHYDDDEMEKETNPRRSDSTIITVHMIL